MPYNTSESDASFARLDANIRRDQDSTEDLLSEWLEDHPDATPDEFEREEQAIILQSGDNNCLFAVVFWLAVAVNLFAQVVT